MKKLVSIMFAVLMLATGVTSLLGQAPGSEKLASGTYIVYARSPQVWRFIVDAKTMANPSVTGRFTTSAGVPKNVEVYVFNEENFWKWRGEDDAARAAAKPVWTSGRKESGDVNVKLPEPGIYYLAISNLYQYEGTKTVDADIKLQYEKK